MARQKFSPRKDGVVLDYVHVICGLGVIIMAALAITNPGKYRSLFPFVFALASVINLFTARFEFKMYPRDRKKLVSAILYGASGVLMIALFIVSAISIFGNS